MKVKFQIETGKPVSQALSRCVNASTGEIIAIFTKGALCLEALDEIKHKNKLLKPFGFKVKSIDGNLRLYKL